MGEISDLRTELESLRELIDIPNELICRFLPDTTITFANRAYLNAFGLTQADVGCRKFVEFVPEAERPAIAAHLAQLAVTGKPVSYRHNSLCKGEWRWHRWTDFPIFNDHGKLVAFLSVGTDITELELTRSQLQRTVDFQRLVAAISHDFIKVDSTNFDDKVNSMLRRAGEFFVVERSYFIRANQHQQTFTSTHEWCALGIPSQSHDVLDAPFADLPWLVKMLNRRKLLVLDSLDDLPDEAAAERKLCQRQGIQSALLIPVALDEEILGFFGFDAVTAPRRWGAGERDLLEVLANVLADAIQKVQAEEILIAERHRAEMASQAKSTFLANISHELRTPLNGMLGFTDLLLKTDLNPTQREYTELALSAGKGLLAVINDLLDFAKIEVGKMDLEYTVASLGKIVQEAFDLQLAQAADKNLRYKLKMPDEGPDCVLLDPLRLKQVLINLLNNAVKFTEAGSVSCTVQCTRLQDSRFRFDFSVQDTGIGIRKDQLGKLFKSFSQADSSTTRKYGGTGLGLVISQMLVRKMGGLIQVTSEPGKGSNFYFSLDLEGSG